MTRLSKPREANLKSQILEYIQILENQGKVYGDRLNSGEILALNKDGSQRLIKLCREGTADIFFIIYGRIIFTETKRKGEKQKPQQKIFQEKVESVGAIYWLVDDFEQFLKLLSDFGITV
jgi:hypothetical protein